MITLTCIKYESKEKLSWLIKHARVMKIDYGEWRGGKPRLIIGTYVDDETAVAYRLKFGA